MLVRRKGTSVACSARAVVACWLVLLAGCAQESTRIVVGAASSLQPLVAALQVAHLLPVDVDWNFAASSALLAQYRAGASMDLLLLADPALAADASDAQRPVLLWRNNIVLAARRGAAPLTGLAALSARGGSIACAAAAVPAGAAARRVLAAAGVLDAVAPALVEAPNVRAALAQLRAGGADFAFVYASDVVEDADIVALWSADPAGPGGVQYAAVAFGRGPAVQALLEAFQSTAVTALARQRGFLAAELR